MKKYLPKHFEEKWSKQWASEKLFQSSAFQDGVNSENKEYLLFAFAYPSGSGLHVGHVEGKTAMDILARYYRMNSKKVFFPVGWDAFGLPAENFAIKSGIHPEKTTNTSIETFKKQIRRLGISYDWETEIATSHPEYYKWTQWLFLQLYHKNLAYKKKAPVNWCESCQTVLANEQVVDGLCERCDNEVKQKNMNQWFFKITKYADELISGLNSVDWPEATKHQQIHWIGKKQGIHIRYPVEKLNEDVVCFTTRPDTNFGATFIVLAPEHPLVEKIISLSSPSKKAEIQEYVDKSSKKKDIDRISEGRKKTGVFTGFQAHQRLSNSSLPIYISDFVLGHVGTGAVVGVPGHDRRDFEFAQLFNIPVKQVVQRNFEYARSYLMGAKHIKPEDLKNLSVQFTKTNEQVYLVQIPNESLESYKQLVREKLSPGFWNEIVGTEIWFCFKDQNKKTKEFILSDKTHEKIARLCSEYNNNPIEETSNILLFLASNEWYTDLIIQEDEGEMINSEFLNGLNIHSATDKMMHHLEQKGWGTRVIDYKLRDWLISRQRYWGAPIPIVYDPTGKPHPVKDAHLPWLLPTDVDFLPTGESPLKLSKEFKERTERLYGKGWTPEFDTMDTFVDSSWYFFRYVSPRDENHFADPNQIKKWEPPELYMIGPEHIVLHLLYSRFLTKFLRDEGLVDIDEPFPKMRHQGIIMGPDGKRMSKSRGNIVNPDTVVDEFGADTLRLYEMFMGPLESDKTWNEKNIHGPYRFLARIWKLFQFLSQQKDTISSDEIKNNVAKTVKKVTEDIEAMKFNTAISSLMALLNILEKNKTEISTSDSKRFLCILAPFAPFMTEEIWREFYSEQSSIHLESWPKVEKNQPAHTKINMPVQVNGKVRAVLCVSEMTEESIIQLAVKDKRIQTYLEGKKYTTVYVPNKILNFVT